MSLLGERVRQRRKELGLTQSQLGGGDLSKGFISLIETGRTKPSVETLMLLARRLQKPVGYFLEHDTSLSLEALRIMLASAWVTLKRGEFTQAAESFEQARVIARKHDDAAEAESCIGLGSALAGLRQLDLARQNVQRGKELAEATRNAQLLVRVHHVVGVIEYYERNFPIARQHFLEGYRLLREVGHPDLSLAGNFLLNIGNTYEEIGDHVEATRWYQEALTALEPTEDLHRIGMAHVQLGAAYRESGRHDIAMAQLTRAEHIFELLNSLRLLAQARNSIGMTLLEQGKTDEAMRQLQSSLHLKEVVGDDPGRARSLTEIARALIAKGAYKEAERTLTKAADITKRFGDTTENARIVLVRARLHREMGQLSDAVRRYKEAITAFDTLGMRLDLATACNELGNVLIRQKRSSDAAPYLARALQSLKPFQEPWRPETTHRPARSPRRARASLRRGAAPSQVSSRR
jgi:HTH-type transcriptional regulator, quorum sensing regulator NprR